MGIFVETVIPNGMGFVLCGCASVPVEKGGGGGLLISLQYMLFTEWFHTFKHKQTRGLQVHRHMSGP